ncbi:helix-turn-helix transcriptional regulator [Pseudonocardia sp. NPDC049154]|uniref:helix-turn-helix domain-containing protein n=1 Tax=Pseudonocardia sp. NPDC049154 TaxID=3155501 RepID=UPI0033E1CD7D
MARPRAVTAVAINGPALRAIRERSGISCSALAREVGADVSFLARVERGEKRGVRMETFERLCFHLEIDPRAIMENPFGTRLARSGPTVVPCGSSTSSTRVA